ncbi:MAG: immunoglobulin-like domain-containing protein [Spirochaetota bacterium]
MKKLHSIIISLILFAGMACSDIGKPENPVAPMTDTEAVAADLAILTITYGSGDSAGNVTQNITLPTTGSNGTTITWATTDSGVVTIGGIVARPDFLDGNASVTLTATITKNLASDNTKTFDLTIIKNPDADPQAVADDKAALAITYGSGDSAGNVTQNVTLPTTGSSGTTISWATTDSGVVTTGGIVTRPDFADGNASVTLTATITKNLASDTKTFNLTVIKNAQTDSEAVADDKSALAITYGSGDSAGNVTQNVTLPTTGSSGTTITWATTNSGVVTTSGIVTRPSFAAGNASVTLTATITKNAANDSKPFNLTVIKLPGGTFTITFNANGGTGAAMADQSITEGDSANLSANTYTRALYVFSGWATTSTGGVAYNDKQSYTMGSSNVTLYAVWTLSANLRIHYDFDGQNCNDSSGNGNNGTASNITYVSDGNGGYYASLNGTSSYIALPNSTVLNSASAFTIMIRFKATAGQYGSLFGYQNTAIGTLIPVITQFVPILTIRSDGKLRGELFTTAALEVISASAVNDGNWHTAYFSAKAGSIALYLDGAQIGINTGTVNHFAMSINQIGTSFPQSRAYMPDATGTNNVSWFYFNGLIDDFYFYNSALH